MFSSGPNFTKLKTNLRLAINRLKLLEKKKMELAQKARKEIADYISSGKVERAKIRVEHIIREDYMVEAMEMLEMFCDLLLARFGLLQQMRVVDPGLVEAVSSVLYAGPRLLADIPELKPICEQLSLKYGKEFADSCKNESHPSISDKFKQRLGVQAPSKLLVEKYLIEISKNYNIDYEPDNRVMKEAEAYGDLLDLSDSRNNLGGGGSGGSAEPPGFRGYPQPPLLPTSDFQPFNYPDASTGGASIGGFVHPHNATSPTSNTEAASLPQYSYNIPPTEAPIHKQMNYMPNFEAPPPSYSNFAKDLPDTPTDANQQISDKPKPTPRSKISPPGSTGVKPRNTDMFPELPNVPDDSPNATGGALDNKNDANDEIDFDDLTKRFEQLKKKK